VPPCKPPPLVRIPRQDSMPQGITAETFQAAQFNCDPMFAAAAAVFDAGYLRITRYIT
jgi:hypothetical protein